MRFSWRHSSRVNPAYEKGAVHERKFREEMETLLSNKSGFDFVVLRATKYTESGIQYVWNERLKAHPTDYLIGCNGMCIAVVEVTSGVEGYSFANSRELHVDEGRLYPMDFFNEGFVVEYIRVGEPHFVWVDVRDVRKSTSRVDEEHRKKWITKPKIWGEGLDGLADKLIALAEHWETQGMQKVS